MNMKTVTENGKQYWIFESRGSKYKARSEKTAYIVKSILEGMSNDDIRNGVHEKLGAFNHAMIPYMRRRMVMKGMIPDYRDVRSRPVSAPSTVYHEPVSTFDPEIDNWIL